MATKRTVKTMVVNQDSCLVEVKASALKGLGVFAKVNIPCGTRVFAETALLKAKGGTAKDIVRAFESLPLSKQSSYLELHEYASESFKRAAEREMGQNWQKLSELHRNVLAIYAANAFGDVFLLGSRINHSCIPNVHFANNSTLQKETFHAIRDILAGEELTITYIGGTNRTRSQRQAELGKWGFQCTCPACDNTLQGREREKKRAELLALDQQLGLINMGIDNSTKTLYKGLQIAQKMAAIQKSEGLLNRELGVSYHDAARYCLKLRNVKMAILWAEKVREVDRYCLGDDHPSYKEETEIVAKLKAAKSPELLDESVAEFYGLHGPFADSCIMI